MADDHLPLAPPDAARILSVSERTQSASDPSDKPPPAPARPFRDSSLATTVLRVARAIEERERIAAVKGLGEDVLGTHDSRGANEDNGFLNLPVHRRHDER